MDRANQKYSSSFFMISWSTLPTLQIIQFTSVNYFEEINIYLFIYNVDTDI